MKPLKTMQDYEILVLAYNELVRQCQHSKQKEKLENQIEELRVCIHEELKIPYNKEFPLHLDMISIEIFEGA